MAQTMNIPKASLINTRMSLIVHDELFKMGVLPEEGRKNLEGFKEYLQKQILAFLIQKQFRKK